MYRLYLSFCCCLSLALGAQDFAPTTVVCQDGPYLLQSPLTDGQTYHYQWERSFDGGSSWTATGSDAPELPVNSPTAGIRYRFHYATTTSCLMDPACRQTTGVTELLVQIPTFNQGRTLCAGDTLFVGSAALTTAGNHRTVIQTESGCDSIVNTFLQILSAHDELFFVDLCPGEDFLGRTFNRDTTIIEVNTAANGCDSINRYEINVSLDDAANLNIDGPTTVCIGEEEVYLTAPGQFRSYAWSTGQTAPSIEVMASGIYELTLTNFTGCEIVLSHELVFVALELTSVTPTSPACPGTETGQINILASGDNDLLYSIDGGESFRGEPDFTDLPPGSYEVVVESVDGCTLSTNTEILPTNPLQLRTDLPETQTIERGDSLQLAIVADFAVEEWRWSPAQWISQPDSATTLAFPLVDTEFRVEAIAAGGCSVQDTFLVTVMDSRRFYAPTAFSPNGDDRNDRWRLFTGPRAEAIIGLQIADRWGGVRYVQQEPALPPEEAGWDGTDNGTPMPPGTYLYSAAIQYADGSSLPVKGQITLMR